MIGFRLFAIADFISVVNNREKNLAKCDQGFTKKLDQFFCDINSKILETSCICLPLSSSYILHYISETIARISTQYEDLHGYQLEAMIFIF